MLKLNEFLYAELFLLIFSHTGRTVLETVYYNNIVISDWELGLRMELPERAPVPPEFPSFLQTLAEVDVEKEDLHLVNMLENQASYIGKQLVTAKEVPGRLGKSK